MKKLLITSIAVFIAFANVMDARQGATHFMPVTELKTTINAHVCAYSLCPFKDKTEFKEGCGNCENGSDCYFLDKIHFEHPTWDYDKCESYLFGN
jgi:hypothetical protein